MMKRLLDLSGLKASLLIKRFVQFGLSKIDQSLGWFM